MCRRAAAANRACACDARVRGEVYGVEAGWVKQAILTSSSKSKQSWHRRFFLLCAKILDGFDLDTIPLDCPFNKLRNDTQYGSIRQRNPCISNPASSTSSTDTIPLDCPFNKLRNDTQYGSIRQRNPCISNPASSTSSTYFYPIRFDPTTESRVLRPGKFNIIIVSILIKEECVRPKFGM